MSEDFLKNPLSLFDVKGKTAIVTGATGAFGAVAAKTLAASGANVVITANNAEGLKKIAAECAKLGGKSEIVAKRPSSEANCDAIVAAAVEKFGGLDILVVASGQNKIVENRRSETRRLSRRDGRQRHAILADGARRGTADDQAGPRRQDYSDVVGARLARASGRLQRVLRVEVGG